MGLLSGYTRPLAGCFQSEVFSFQRVRLMWLGPGRDIVVLQSGMTG